MDGVRVMGRLLSWRTAERTVSGTEELEVRETFLPWPTSQSTSSK